MKGSSKGKPSRRSDGAPTRGPLAVSFADIARTVARARSSVTRAFQGPLRACLLEPGRGDIAHPLLHEWIRARGGDPNDLTQGMPAFAQADPKRRTVSPVECAAIAGRPLDEVLDAMHSGGRLAPAVVSTDGHGGPGYLCLALATGEMIGKAFRGMTVDEFRVLAEDFEALTPGGRYVDLAKLIAALPE